jgi:anhydro-N-acetylmuramic acid kinase
MIQTLVNLSRKDPRFVVGLISGTSADGIDAALVEISGSGLGARFRLLEGLTLPLPREDREEVLAMCDPATATVDRLTSLDFRLGELFAEAALAVISRAGMRPDLVDLIGSAGQTVWHIPAPSGATMQIGQGAVIAERTGLPVIEDFRVADVAAGGHGAPLVPYFDLVAYRSPNLSRAVQNIGGIGNVTYLPARQPDGCGPEDVLAFDTGPGNIAIDGVVRLLTDGGREYDEDGAMARRGRVHAGWLKELLEDPYLRLPPPKSTGREVYGLPYARRLLDEARNRGMSPDDTVATVSAFTADSIVGAYREFLMPLGPIDEVVLCGGGAYNPFLRDRIAAALRVPVRHTDELGVDGNLKEAMAFALMAPVMVYGMPSCRMWQSYSQVHAEASFIDEHR